MTFPTLSDLAVPLILLLTSALFLSRKRDGLGSFLCGAEEGIRTCQKLLPTLCLLLCAVRMFRASGLAAALSSLLSPLLSPLGIPAELLPFLLTRPISGSASMAMLSDLFSSSGADSFPAVCASVIMASSDTLVYVFAIYFSSVGIKKTRYALPVAVTVMLFDLFSSLILCRILFPSGV